MQEMYNLNYQVKSPINFEDIQCVYRYQIYTTNLNLAAAEIWRVYSQRADSENRIQELKYDFGIEGYCPHDF